MQVNVFPTVNSIYPYKSTVSTPVTKVMFTDTPYTVPSHGLTSEWYTWPIYTNVGYPSFTSTYKRWQSTTPLVKWFFGKSHPPEISDYYADTRQYGVKYTGYFYASAASATLTFYGNGNVFARFNTTALASTSIGTAPDRNASVRVTGLSIGSWYPVTVRFWSTDKNSGQDNVFVGLWKNSTIQEYQPISAGYFISAYDYATHAGFIPATQLSYITDIRLERQKGQISKLTFSIPIVSATALLGYSFNADTDTFTDVDVPQKYIKKFRKVDFYTGYQYAPSTLVYTEKFSGQVRGWSVRKTTNGEAVADVECYDWSNFLSDTINSGFPNISDYITHIYQKRTTTSVAYSEQPRCYDAWTLNDAVSNLLINSYIDPKLLVQKQRVMNPSGSIISGKYLMFDRNNTNALTLDRNFKYGNPLNVDPDSADEKYIWQFSIGERVLDNVQRLMDTYGYEYGFNELGYFYINSVGNPITIKGPEKITYTGSWTEDVDADALYAYSKYSNTVTNKAVATFTGNACAAIFAINSGVSGTVHIKVSNSVLGMVATTNYRLKHTRAWKYFNGVDSTLGYNPVFVNINNISRYGLYSLNMTVKLGRVNVNGIFGYNKDYNNSCELFNTYGTPSNNEHSLIVDNLNYTSSVDNLRNDVLVVGRLKGVVSGLSLNTEDKQTPVNPNNPVSTHVVARAMDKSSIGSMSSSNYVGRPLQTIIIEPTISSEERAGWVATETVKRFNEYQKSIEPQISIIGHPLLEVGDYVKVKDYNTKTLATLHNFWISSIYEQYTDKGDYIANLGLESFKPWNSYFRYPTPSLKKFNYSAFYNIRSYNTGLFPATSPTERLQYTRTSAVTTGTIYTSYYKDTTDKSIYDTLVSDFNTLVPSKGFIKIGTEVIKYNNRTSTVTNRITTIQTNGNLYRISGSIYFKSLVRGEYMTTELPHATLIANPLVDCAVSPYSYDEFGIVPGFEFDVLYPGFVRVSVEGNDGNLLDVLTGNEVPSQNTGWIFVNSGRNYFYNWGMIDRIGKYNETNSGEFPLAGGSTDTPSQLNSNLGYNDITWELYGPYTGRYGVGPGFYAQNSKNSRFGTFQVKLEYQTFDKSIPIQSDLRTIPNYIYSTLRHTGSAVNHVTSGIQEELDIVNSTLNSSGVGTIWFNKATNQRVGMYLNKVLRQYYTGRENSNQGILFNILNKFNNKRIANLSVDRYIFPIWNIRALRRPYSYKGALDPYEQNIVSISLDAGVEEYITNSSNWMINGTTPLSLGITTPDTPFCPPKLRYALDKYFTKWEDSDLYWHYFNVHAIMLIHLHVLHIKAIDQAGFKSQLIYPIYWMDPNISSTKTSFYDSTRNYDFGLMQQKGLSYAGVNVINGNELLIPLPTEIANASKPPIANNILKHRDIDGDYKGLVVKIPDIPAVLIYGTY